jgi:Uma2 family endonuclease
MTASEYFAGAETAAPRELAFGTLRVADAPLVPHQRMVRQLLVALHEHVERHRLGEVWVAPVDVVLDVDRALIVQPDLVFISNERQAIVQDRIRGAPDLAIEVLSPDPRIGSVVERLRWFAAYDVRECWLVHVYDRRVEVVQFGDGAVTARNTFGGDDPIRSPVLEGFERTLGSITGW